jgi:beta-xylosidase
MSGGRRALRALRPPSDRDAAQDQIRVLFVNSSLHLSRCGTAASDIAGTSSNRSLGIGRNSWFDALLYEIFVKFLYWIDSISHKDHFLTCSFICMV